MPRTPTPRPAYSLETLDRSSRAALAALFERVTGAPAPARASRALLRDNLAWTLQALQSGQQPAARRAQLIRQYVGASTGTARPKSVTRPGTRLVREWQGVLYEVTVLESGFAWEGRTYKSLSPIATAITGTRWSGPRFFNVRETAP